MTDGLIFSDEEIRRQIAENHTRREEYQNSYMTPEERERVKKSLLVLVGSIPRALREAECVGDLDADVLQQCINAAALLAKEF